MNAHDETAIENKDAASAAASAVQPAADTPAAKQRRGFAAMDKEARRELARSGGLAAHAVGLANQFTSEKAREAGKKGGAAIAADREHMRAIGRKGGLGKRGFRKVRTDAK